LGAAVYIANSDFYDTHLLKFFGSAQINTSLNLLTMRLSVHSARAGFTSIHSVLKGQALHFQFA